MGTTRSSPVDIAKCPKNGWCFGSTSDDWKCPPLIKQVCKLLVGGLRHQSALFFLINDYWWPKMTQCAVNQSKINLQSLASDSSRFLRCLWKGLPNRLLLHLTFTQQDVRRDTGDAFFVRGFFGLRGQSPQCRNKKAERHSGENQKCKKEKEKEKNRDFRSWRRRSNLAG